MQTGDREQVERETGAGAPGSGSSTDGHDVLALLSGQNPREILLRIVPGDPLGLESICRERTSQRAVLIDPMRVLARAFARTAQAAVDDGNRCRPDLGTWLGILVDRSIEDLIREDASEVAPALPAGATEPYYERVAQELGLQPGSARRVCVAFNRLDERARQVFFTVVIDGGSVAACVAGKLGTLDEVRAMLLQGMQTLMLGEPAAERPGARENGG